MTSWKQEPNRKMICTENNTISLDLWIVSRIERRWSDKFLLSVVQPIIGILAVLLNLSFLIVVAKRKSMHTTTNVYLANLAIADLFYSAYTTIIHLTETSLSPINRDVYFYGAIGCILDPYLRHLGFYASLLFVNVVSYERFLAICHPLQHRAIASKRRTASLVLVGWITAVILSIPKSLTVATYTAFCASYPDGYSHYPNIIGTCQGTKFIPRSIYRPILHTAFWFEMGSFILSVFGKCSVLPSRETSRSNKCSVCCTETQCFAKVPC